MIKLHILLGLIFMSASPSQAQNVCDGLLAQRHEVGFSISKKQLQILSGNQFTLRNRIATEAQKVARAKKHISSYRKEISEISDQKLAETIVRVALATGVDFSILSSVVRKESLYCKSRHNKGGGDSGCMQFTTAGLSELKHQFSLAGKKNHSPGVPEVLKSLVNRFYLGQQKKADQFYTWLKAPIQTQKLALRAGKNIEGDILAGALLLKVYLSKSNGNYLMALRQYNSSAKKIAYANDALNVATKVNLTDSECWEGLNFAESVVKDSCSVNEDEACMPEDESLMMPFGHQPQQI